MGVERDPQRMKHNREVAFQEIKLRALDDFYYDVVHHAKDVSDHPEGYEEGEVFHQRRLLSKAFGVAATIGLREVDVVEEANKRWQAAEEARLIAEKNKPL